VGDAAEDLLVFLPPAPAVLQADLADVDRLGAW
jgi:hypothetical protein